MTPEEIRGWAAIILSTVVGLGVAIYAARAAWKNSRKSSSEAVELKTWPTYGELVTENRNLRNEVDGLRGEMQSFRDEIAAVRETQEKSERRETIAFRYLAALREHILMQLPPPPPAVPFELADLFEDFESTYPRGSA